MGPSKQQILRKIKNQIQEMGTDLENDNLNEDDRSTIIKAINAFYRQFIFSYIIGFSLELYFIGRAVQGILRGLFY